MGEAARFRASHKSGATALIVARRWSVFAMYISALVTCFNAQAWAQTTERVSVSTSGEQANDENLLPSISADGRYVVFYSFANNLVPGDTNDNADVFVHDRLRSATERVSVSSSGQQGDSASFFPPSISADGRFVVFGSLASNLIPGDTNGTSDVFVHDRMSGTTKRVSVSSSGQQGNDESDLPLVSADGRFVAFQSDASNLVPGDTNEKQDVFVHDRVSGVTERVSVSTSGQQGNDESYSYSASLSADGRFVAFHSRASNLVSDDTNGLWDVFVHDRANGVTERVSVSSSGQQGNSYSEAPSISADGRFVAFSSGASNLVPSDTNNVDDVFVHDRMSGVTERVSASKSAQQGDSNSYHPSISSDGRFVTFYSYASNLVPSDADGWSDIFVHDRVSGAIDRVSVSTSGQQGNSQSYQSRISADGRSVVFYSFASNLVADDTNGTWDVFVHDRSTALLGDLNGDGFVNGADLAILLANWGPCGGGCVADLNDEGDGVVNGADLAVLLANWSP